MLFDILKKNNKDVRLSGNIGRPILNEKHVKKSTFFIIEISSYQIEYSKIFKANFAAPFRETWKHKKLYSFQA